jgi:hypothetical protein
VPDVSQTFANLKIFHRIGYEKLVAPSCGRIERINVLKNEITTPISGFRLFLKKSRLNIL